MRLAERRGVLTGVHLSEVQEWAVSMLSIMDQRDDDDLRSRVVAAHPDSARYVFPEWFSGSVFEEAAKPDGTYDIDKIDPRQIEWTVPTSKEEAAELDRWIAERSQGTVTGKDLSEGGWT
jgi:hypothetical protein